MEYLWMSLDLRTNFDGHKGDFWTAKILPLSSPAGNPPSRHSQVREEGKSVTERFRGPPTQDRPH